MIHKRLAWVVLLAMASTLVLGACGPTPEPQVIEKIVTQIVEVAGTPVIQEVEVTSVVEVEKVVTATPEPSAPAGPKVLRQRLEHDIRTLDPAFHYSDIEEFAASPVFNGLVTFGPNSYDIVNDLAESIESSEDGKEITFKLKEGVQWHRGYGEVTAEDVKFSYERYAQVDSPYKDDWATLDQVEVIDKYTGKIILKEPFAPLWHSTLPTPRGWVLPKKYIEEVGDEKFGTDPVGSGPYLFSEWRPQDRVILTRNEEYFGEPGGFEEIDLIVIEENKAAEIAMEAGELDITYVSHAAADLFEADSDFSVIRKPQLHYRWIGMNVEHPKLQDENIRQAIRYAIDVPSILQAAYLGQVEQEYTLIPPGLLGH
jgi:peptide/nickel transport system substrate-binding protein